MVLVNRILSALVVLAAIAALVFGVLLAKHRTAARERGDLYASNIYGISTELDNGSATNVRVKVEPGNLAWKPFETSRSEVESNLKVVVKQAQDTVAQRDKLAAALTEDIGKKYGSEVVADDLKNQNTYAENLTKVTSLLDKARTRDVAITEKLAAMAEDIKANVSADNLKSLEGYDADLTVLTDAVSTNYQRNQRLKGSITSILTKADPAGEIGMTAEDIDNASADKLNSLIAKLDVLQAALVEANELKITKKRLEDTNKSQESQIAGLSESNATLSNTVKELEEKVKTVAKTDTGFNAGPSPTSFEGHIVSVNYDLNYVIIDLGAKDRLPNNVELAVARDREFLTNIRVQSVFNDYAVADILPELMVGTVIPGDAVVFFNANN